MFSLKLGKGCNGRSGLTRPDTLLFIKMGWVFVGSNAGGRGDIAYSVARMSDGSILVLGNWDHYDDPKGINDTILKFNFEPDYFELANGDSLQMEIKNTYEGVYYTMTPTTVPQSTFLCPWWYNSPGVIYAPMIGGATAAMQVVIQYTLDNP